MPRTLVAFALAAVILLTAVAWAAVVTAPPSIVRPTDDLTEMCAYIDGHGAIQEYRAPRCP